MDKYSPAQLKIQQALIDLIHEKGLQAVTVSDITRKAKINRGTFYLHYTDKQNLLEAIEGDIFDTIVEHFSIAFAVERTPLLVKNEQLSNDELLPIVEILEYLYSERELINALVSEKGDPGFLSSFRTVFVNSIMKKIFDAAMVENFLPHIPKDYVEVMTFSLATQAILHWLSKEEQDDIYMIARLMVSTFIHY